VGSTPGERRLRIAIGAALLAATAVVYAPVAGHEFVDLDDWAGILWNPDLRVGSLGEALWVAFTRAQVSMWAPLTTLTLQLDWALYGSDPTGYLLTNVVLHATSSLLLFVVCLRLTGATWASAFVAAAFALHPLHVESVAWASERKDVLSGLFFVLTLLAYERYVRNASSYLRYALVLLCLGIGLLAKPMLVTLPCVLLLLDYWPLQRLDARAVREKLPMFALVGVVSLITLQVQAMTGALAFGLDVPLWARAANAIEAYTLYFARSFWPTQLAAHYPHPGATIEPLHLAFQLVLLGGITTLAYLRRRTHPYELTGWLWFAGMLVPVIGLVQVGDQARADRYMYLPLIGLAIAVAFAVRDAVRGHRGRERAALGLAVAAVLALGVASSAQVRTWRSSTTLFQRIIQVSPGYAFPYLRLGMIAAMETRYVTAREYFDLAFERDPSIAADAVDQLESMAAAHATLGRPGPAVETAELAIEVAVATDQRSRADAIRARMREFRRARPPTPGSDQRR
jgi:hypothetical protein